MIVPHNGHSPLTKPLRGGGGNRLTLTLESSSTRQCSLWSAPANIPYISEKEALQIRGVQSERAVIDEIAFKSSSKKRMKYMLVREFVARSTWWSFCADGYEGDKSRQSHTINRSDSKAGQEFRQELSMGAIEMNLQKANLKIWGGLNFGEVADVVILLPGICKQARPPACVNREAQETLREAWQVICMRILRVFHLQKSHFEKGDTPLPSQDCSQRSLSSW